MSFNTPILFLVFNRPDTTLRVFEKIREIQPKKLYIAADGARKGNENDLRKCKDVLEIVNNIDWDCEVKTLFRENNLGCKLAVSGAISWFFENEEMGIILEDDCLPDKSFFPYCAELLEKFKDDERVAGISGSNLLNYTPENGDSYFFSKYVHIWGWATWRRVWKMYDVAIENWPESRAKKTLRSLSDGNMFFESHWSIALDKTYEGKIDTWDYQFHFMYMIRNMMSCVPSVNLVSNIGFHQDATHTLDENHPAKELSIKQINFPLIHPASVKREKQFDKRFDKDIFRMNYKNRILELYGIFKSKL